MFSYHQYSFVTLAQYVFAFFLKFPLLHYGFHLILATNSYLKNHFNRALLNSFPYIITFDLASEEQAKYLKIQGADLLKAGGEILIKCRNNDILKMQTPYISNEEIKKVVDFIKEQS